eukprot:TRINITY_DN2029_c0_g1_i5.p1 TRINITY_DN2029_c0_g1~~TRINITY_DN2029_c0_g1_i5.p1  ORF type:complete len:323 (+),score=81.25 TRINITY_DN2029_c0_g1_i5:115-1083(+)
MKSFVAFILLFAPLVAGFVNPYDPPLYKSSNTTIKKGTELPRDLFVWYPEQEGVFPVLFFMSGFGGNAPYFIYTNLMGLLSGHGVVIVAIDAVLTNPADWPIMANNLITSFNWLGQHKDLTAYGVPSTVQMDLSRFALAGHSSGNQAVVQSFLMCYNDTSLCQVSPNVLLLLDPVDGDPAHMSQPVLKTNDTIPWRIPVMIMASGLGGVPGMSIPYYPACCLPGVSSYHFYTAFQTPKWFVNATAYGHADCLDDSWASIVANSHFCTGTDASLHPYFEFRRFLAGSIYSFMASNLLGQTEYLPYLEDPSTMPIAASTQIIPS